MDVDVVVDFAALFEVIEVIEVAALEEEEEEEDVVIFVVVLVVVLVVDGSDSNDPWSVLGVNVNKFLPFGMTTIAS